MSEAPANLWALSDAQAQSARIRPVRRARPWTLKAVPVLVLATVLGVALAIPRELGNDARTVLFVFGVAVILWSLTKLNAAYVALGAVLAAALTGAIPQDELFEALEADVVWLMIGAFIVGAAVRNTGLADRLTRSVTARARNAGQMIWLVTLALLPLAFVIPSTSGRAAVALPVFRSLSDAARSQKVTRALALLIPAVILVSTIVSLIGAGSHLVANDLLDEVTDRRIGFAEWILYGAPFGIVATLICAFVISRMFLDRHERARTLSVTAAPRPPLSRPELTTLAVVAVMAVLWMTTAGHGLEVATVSVLGAFVLALPGIGVLTWKEGLRSVSWDLIIFVGAALVLGEALISTGAAKWLVDGMFDMTGLSDGGSVLAVLLAVTIITLTSHVYLTSHTARAAALVPPLLYLAIALGLNPVAMMFIATVGMNYCLTFPISSKALIMFGEIDQETWRPADLLKLSAVLLPIHALLMMVFYFAWWRHVGLSL